MRRSKISSDKVLIAIFYMLLALIALICLFPIVFAFIGSLSTEDEVTRNGFTLFPETISFDTYKYVFQTQGPKSVSYTHLTLPTTSRV